MSIDLGSLNVSFGLDASQLISGASTIDGAFGRIEASGKAMESSLDGALTGIEAAFKSSATAAEGAVGGFNAAGDAAKGVAADVSTVEDAARQAATGIGAIDDQAKSAAAAMGVIGQNAKIADAGLDAAGASAAAASTGIKRAGDAADQAARGFNKAGPEAQSFGQKVKAAESDIREIGFALAGIGAVISAGLGLAVAAFVGFEKAMRNVNSIAGLAEDELASLGDAIGDISANVGKGPTELAEGLYEIQSSGFEAADGLIILEKAAIAATAGLTDTATGARAVTAVLNAYGQGAEEAGNVSDLLFQTVNAGVISFESLANNLGQVLPIASALGVPFEEISAAMAQLTLNGISAAQAETALAAAMRAAINPTTELAAAVDEAGYASAEAVVQSEGLVGFLQLLTEASGGTTEGLAALLGSAEATTAVLALMNDGGVGLVQTVGEMSAAMQDGATAQKVFDEQSKSTAFAMQQFRADLESAQIAAGAAIAPFVNLALNGVGALVRGFTSLPGPVQGFVASITGVVGVTAGLAGAMLLALPQINNVRMALSAFPAVAKGLQAALTFMTGPVGIGLVALGASIALVTTYWQKHKKATQEAEEAYQRLKDAIKLTDDIVKNLNLRGEFELADSIKAEIDQARAELTRGQTLFQKELPAFFNIDLETLNPEEMASTITDFLNKGIGGAVLDWANSSDFEFIDQSIIDVFKVDQSTLDKAIQGLLGGDGTKFGEILGNLTADELNVASQYIQAAVTTYYESFAITPDQLAAVEGAFTPLFELMTNPNIDTTKLLFAIDTIMQAFADGDITIQETQTKLQSLYADITTGADTFQILSGEFEGAAINAGEFSTAVGLMSTALEQVESVAREMKFEGLEQASIDVAALGDSFELLATPITITNSFIDEATGQLIYFQEEIGLTSEQAADLAYALGIVNDALASGDYDNARLIADLMAIINNPNLTPLERQAQVLDLVINGMDEYILTAEQAASGTKVYMDALEPVPGALNKLTEASIRAKEGMDAVLGAAGAGVGNFVDEGAVRRQEEGIASLTRQIEDQIAAVQEWKDAAIAFVADSANILNILAEIQNQAGQPIPNDLSTAMGIQEAAIGLDSILQTFADIEALAARSSNAAGIADTLIGVPGELGLIQDLWVRINDGTSQAVLSAEDYNAAISAGTAIQESNARVQDDILVIQAKQVPLLERQQQAYEDQIHALSLLNADEAQRAIYLQSSAGSAAVAEQYATAYAVSLGEIPPEVATEMIANAAQADPVLKDILLSYGLIEEGANGEITVNFDDGPTLTDVITTLSDSINALTLAIGGVPPVEIEVTGADALDEANRKVELLKDKRIQIFIETVETTTSAPSTPVGAIGGGNDALNGGGRDIGAEINAAFPDIETSNQQAALAALGSAFAALTTQVAPSKTAVVDWKTVTVAGLQEVPPAIVPVGTGFQQMGATVGQSLTTMSTTGMTQMRQLSTTTIQSGQQMNQGVVQATTTMATSSTQQMTRMAQVGAQQMQSMASQMTAGANQARAGVQGALSAIPGIVSNIGNQAASNAYAAGANISSSLASGIRSRIGEIQAAASAAAAAANAAANAGFGIASPSKVWTAMGDNITTSLENAIKNGTQDVVRAAGNVAYKASTTANGNIVVIPPKDGTPGTGGDGNPVTDTSTWKDIVAKGLEDATSGALKNSGLETDKTIGSLFNEADWLARVEKMGEKRASDISDIFYGRRWQNSTDATIMDGKYLEQYLGGVIPGEDITNQPPGGNPGTDPTRPPGSPRLWVRSGNGAAYQMNRANTLGGNNAQAPQINHTTVYALDTPSLMDVMSKGAKGSAAHGALKNASSKRMQTGGARPAPVRG